jgi:hypothetical protein
MLEMKLGNTFLIEHLWIVVSLPTAEGHVALVSFTTRRWNSDASCVVQAGEHPWVKHETVVEYEKARVFDLPTQQKVLANKMLRPQADVSRSLLQRIQLGALSSDLAAQKVQALIKWSMAEQAKKTRP